jgi:hypothetical protein
VIKAVDLMMQNMVTISGAVVEMGMTADGAPGSKGTQGPAMAKSSGDALTAARDGKGVLCDYQATVDSEDGVVAFLLDQFASLSQMFFYASWAAMLFGLLGTQV